MILADMLLSLIQASRRNPNSTLRLFRHFGAAGLFFLAILDGTPFPTFGGPDILLVILVATRRNPWYEYAAAATVGAVLGAYITFRLARRAGQAYLESTFGRRRIPKLLKAFDRWGTGVLLASSAIPVPLPTSAFFAAAGASNGYSTSKFVSAVAVARALRYSVIGIIAHLYGRRMIRVLRHPTQYWGWLLVFGGLFVALIIAGVVLNRRIAVASS
jgi:membrane protein YqaA with SNARE-associated domain